MRRDANNIGLPRPDSSRSCSVNASEVTRRAFYGIYLPPLGPHRCQLSHSPACSITSNNTHTCLYSRLCAAPIQILRVLNFAFWCKSTEISNFSARKNSHLKDNQDTTLGGVSLNQDTTLGGVSLNQDTTLGGVSLNQDTTLGGVSLNQDTTLGGVSWYNCINPVVSPKLELVLGT